MRKFTHLDALDAPRRPRSKAPMVYLFVLLVLVTPPAFEVAKINVARFGLFGLSGRVDTPILDTLSKNWEVGSSDYRDWITPLIARRRWNPNFVLPIAFFWAAVAAMMLRRSH